MDPDNARHVLGLDLCLDLCINNYFGQYKNIWPFHLISNLYIQIMTKCTLLFIISDLKGQGRT